MSDVVWKAAKEMYETSENRVKPSWDQCNEATRSVWYEVAELKLSGHPTWWSIHARKKA